MRWHVVGGEAWRNVRSGTARVGWSVAVIGMLCTGLLIACLGDTHRIGVGAQQYRAAGAAIVAIQAPEHIDGGLCEAVSKSGTYATGALRRTDDLEPLATPGSAVPTFEVTAGFAAVLDGSAGGHGAGLLVSEEAARYFGVQAGDVLATSHGAVGIASVYPYPADGRESLLEFAFLIPVTSSSPFDECWAATWPERRQTEQLLRATLTPQADGAAAGDAVVFQLNAALGSSFDAAAQFAARPTRLLPVAGILAAFAFQFVLFRTRRIELASALHAGVRRHDLWAIAMLESIWWVAGAIVVAAPVAAWFVNAAPSADSSAYLGGALVILAGVSVAGLAGASVGVLSCRERSLFAYFKSRR